MKIKKFEFNMFPVNTYVLSDESGEAVVIDPGCFYPEEKQKFDYVVSRAVMPLTDLLKIIRKNISTEQRNALPNGLICLKGGELEKEVMPVKNRTDFFDLKNVFEEEFFETKKVVYVPVN